MGISILESVMEIEDEDFGEWLWSFCICCGRTRKAAAERCARCALQAANLIEVNRQQVLDAIHERLGAHGFDPESTYQDWLASLRQIAVLSAASTGECTWCAPEHPRGRRKSIHVLRQLQGTLDKAETIESRNAT
ncbi:MAG TPA: hypothetical protein VG796_05445 [Verrucomicrobiales bacterium]|nr:hypothetical protein [Verrucomicrobiales bacterium]